MKKVDVLIGEIDAALRTLFPPRHRKSTRPSPAISIETNPLDESSRKVSESLMRVNHSGEVCAQALYLGQAFSAKTPKMKHYLYEAALDETDHLAWCEARLQDLNGHVSYLNPLWYTASWVLGATTGYLGDKISLGLVSAVEWQVEAHLAHHMGCLPAADKASMAILVQMKQDEMVHAESALQQGGVVFPLWLQHCMRMVSKVMTNSSYYW